MSFSKRGAAWIAGAIALIALNAASAAIIGIDYGSEIIKVSAVMPGKAFDIVMDEHSKRKIPNLLSFDSTERHFATAASSMVSKKPKQTYVNSQWLLGKSPASPQVQRFTEHGYPYTFVPLDSRGTVGIQHDDDTVFSPELLVSMMLQYLKTIAEKQVGQEAKDAVITVPAFWTQKERQALLDAASLAGLNVLSLLNENVAGAIQYGIDFDFQPEQTYNIIFYNMGAAYTQVSLVQYSSYIKKQGKQNKTIGQLEVKATTYDETLGGQAFDQTIHKRLLSELQALVKKNMGSDAPDITTVPRAVSKLRVAARKAKEVLSANMETPITIESAYQDIDFRSRLSRETFYEMSKDLLDRVPQPVEKLLEHTQMQASDIHSVVLLGGSTRIPQVEKVLKDYLVKIGHTKELAKNIDADEAMAMGAAFFAANLSTQFRVRPLGLTDVSMHAIGVRFAELPGYVVDEAAGAEATDGAATGTDAADGAADDAVAAAAASKKKAFTKRASLFNRFNQLSKRKSVVFSHERDFQCTLQHDSPATLPAGATIPIALFNITGLSAMAAHADNSALLKTQRPKVSLAFLLSSSGIVDLVKAEATLEESVEAKVPKKKAKPAAASDAKKNETESSEDSAKGDAAAAPAEEAAAAAPGEHSEPAADTDAAKPDAAAATDAPAAADTKEEVEYEVKMQKKTHTFPLSISRDGADIKPMQAADKAEARAVLAKLNAADAAKKEIDAAKNELEAFVYNTRTKLSDEAVSNVTTQEQRDTLSAKLETVQDWLYEQADDEPTKFRVKLKELKELYDPIVFRVDQAAHLPAALNATVTLLNFSRVSLEKMETERPWIKNDSLKRLGEMLNETESWVQTKLAEQALKAPHETPALTYEELYRKLRPITSLTSDLLKIKKPKPKKAPKAKNANGTADGNSTAGANATGTAEDAEKPAAIGKEDDLEEVDDDAGEQATEEEQEPPAAGAGADQGSTKDSKPADTDASRPDMDDAADPEHKHVEL